MEDIPSVLMHLEMTLDSIVKLAGKPLSEFVSLCVKMLPEECSPEDSGVLMRWGDCFPVGTSVWFDVAFQLLELFRVPLQSTDAIAAAGAGGSGGGGGYPSPACMCGALEILLLSVQRSIAVDALSLQQISSRHLSLVRRAYETVGRLSQEDALVNAIVAEKRGIREEQERRRKRGSSIPLSARDQRRSRRVPSSSSSGAKRKRSIYADLSDFDESSCSSSSSSCAEQEDYSDQREPQSEEEEEAKERRLMGSGNSGSRVRAGRGEQQDRDRKETNAVAAMTTSPEAALPAAWTKACEFSKWFRSAQRVIEETYESPHSYDTPQEHLSPMSVSHSSGAGGRRGKRRTRDVELWHEARKIVFSVRSEILSALLRIYQRLLDVRGAELLRFSTAAVPHSGEQMLYKRLNVLPFLLLILMI